MGDNLGVGSYYGAIISRARQDTLRWIRGHGVIEFLVIVVPFPLAVLVQNNESIDRLAIATLVSLAALGALVMAVFTINLVMAPVHLAREARGKIEKLSQELGEKQSREAIANGLTDLYQEGERILDDLAKDLTRPHVWEKMKEDWRQKVEIYLRENVSVTSAATWDAGYLGLEDILHYKGGVITGVIGLTAQQLDYLREQLRPIMRRYEYDI